MAGSKGRKAIDRTLDDDDDDDDTDNDDDDDGFEVP